MATFGYDPLSTPGSFVSTGQKIRATKWTAPAGGGSITSLTAYAKYETLGAVLGGAIYADSAGAPATKLAEDSGNAALGVGYGWVTVNIAYDFSSEQVLWLAIFSSSMMAGYDAGAASQSARQPATFETWPNPFGAPEAYSNIKFGIYVTYTPAAAGTVVPQIMAAQRRWRL